MKQNSECCKVKKNFFYPISLKPDSSQSSDFVGTGSEGVGDRVGERRLRGVLRWGGMTDQGEVKGHTSADTQLSKPDQLHFIRNLRPITA